MIDKVIANPLDGSTYHLKGRSLYRCTVTIGQATDQPFHLGSGCYLLTGRYGTDRQSQNVLMPILVNTAREVDTAAQCFILAGFLEFLEEKWQGEWDESDRSNLGWRLFSLTPIPSHTSLADLHATNSAVIQRSQSGSDSPIWTFF